jgi:tape measure domain-containing protein
MFQAGSIASTLGLDISPFAQGMLQATSIAQIFPATVTNFLANPLLGVIGIAKDLGSAMTDGISSMVSSAVGLASAAEQAQVSFTTMLGDAGKAQTLLAEINQFAAETPFETAGLIAASKSLLAFGTEADDVIPTLRMLGDLASGLNIPLGELAELYGKAQVQGRLMAQDVNQLTGRGIPIIQEFAKQFGVSESAVRDLVESGQVGFPQLQKALQSLTSDGGKFAGMMGAQSQTVAGLFSTLKDSVSLNLTHIGEMIIEKLDLRGVIGKAGEAVGQIATAVMPSLEMLVGKIGDVVSGAMETDHIEAVLSVAREAIVKLVDVGAFFLDWLSDMRPILNLASVAVEIFARGLAGAAKSLYVLKELASGNLNFKEGLASLSEALTSNSNVMQDWSSSAVESFRRATDAAEKFKAAQLGMGAFTPEETANAIENAKRVNAGVYNGGDFNAGGTPGKGGLGDFGEGELSKGAVNAAEKVQAAIERMQREIGQFGMSEMEKAIEDFSKLAGATDDDIAEFARAAYQLQTLKRGAVIDRELENFFDAVENEPKTRAGLDRPTKFADYVAAGSADALRLQYTIGHDSKDDVAKKQLSEAQKQSKALEDLNRKAQPATPWSFRR